MKKKLLYCSLSLMLLACNKPKDEEAPQIGDYLADYMVHSNQGIFYTSFRRFSFEFANGKVMKRIGGPDCNGSNLCPDNRTIIDEMTYGNNTIGIKNRSGHSDWSILKEEWLYGLNSKNQPAYLIYTAENRKMYDSLAYTYQSNGKVKQIVTYSVYRDADEVVVNKDYTKDFFFNAAGNLEKVETRRLLDDGYVSSLVVEKFDKYDNAVNPFKRLFLFGDTYYRSLSENNFQGYRKEHFDVRSGEVIGSQGRDWVLKYDTAGRPLFDKP